MLRLLAGAIGEADDREARDAALDVGFDLDAAGVEADEGMRDRAGEHCLSTLAGQHACGCADCVPKVKR